MTAMELLTTRRTYRRFAQKAVPQDVVDDIVQAVRLSSCGANRQAVRLVLVQSPEMVAKVQPLVKWAGYLPPEQGTPKADELPTFYAAVVQDTAIPGDLATDTGIALANMTLAAWDKGVGSCIMGAIDKPALTALLGIEEPQKLAFMVAFGYPTHKAGIVPMTEQTGVKYYLDANRDYCVPKRSAEEIARSLQKPVYTAYIHIFSPLLHKCLQNRFNFTDYYAQVLTFRFVQTILSAFPESAMNRIPSGQGKLYCIDRGVFEYEKDLSPQLSGCRCCFRCRSGYDCLRRFRKLCCFLCGKLCRFLRGCFFRCC